VKRIKFSPTFRHLTNFLNEFLGIFLISENSLKFANFFADVTNSRSMVPRWTRWESQRWSRFDRRSSFTTTIVDRFPRTASRDWRRSPTTRCTCSSRILSAGRTPPDSSSAPPKVCIEHKKTYFSHFSKVCSVTGLGQALSFCCILSYRLFLSRLVSCYCMSSYLLLL